MCQCKRTGVSWWKRPARGSFELSIRRSSFSLRSATLHGFRVPTLAAATSFLPFKRRRTQFWCPVRVPESPRRRRHFCFAPAAMHASCCSSVSASLYSFEAAANRARQRSCVGVWGSLGLAQRRRHCLVPRIYHTQSPHRPLLITGSRHSPRGPQNLQSLHRSGLKGRRSFAAYVVALVVMFHRWTPLPRFKRSLCAAVAMM